MLTPVSACDQNSWNSLLYLDTQTAVLADAFRYMGDQSEALAAMHPFRGLGEVDDLTGPAVFLASADARWITGAILAVDGGYTAQ